MKLTNLLSTLKALPEVEVVQPEGNVPYSPYFISLSHDAYQTVLHTATSEEGDITLMYGFNEPGTQEGNLEEFFYQFTPEIEAFCKQLLAMYSDEGVNSADIEL